MMDMFVKVCMKSITFAQRERQTMTWPVCMEMFWALGPTSKRPIQR